MATPNLRWRLCNRGRTQADGGSELFLRKCAMSYVLSAERLPLTQRNTLPKDGKKCYCIKRIGGGGSS